jgi:5-methylcytosine-specific restriction protein A
MAQLRKAKKAANPMCEWADEHGRCRRPAAAVDHIIPNAEDPTLRYVWTNLQSLCKPHHDKKTTADALRGKTRAR